MDLALPNSQKPAFIVSRRRHTRELPKRVNLAANKTLDPRQRYDNIVLPGLALRTVTPIPGLLFRFLSPTFGTQRSYDELVFASFQQSLILN
ncbi:MAG TPA: hypothetical protein VIH58_09945 [Chthoniobacterales bacterium]